jgi:hypothetical protein
MPVSILPGSQFHQVLTKYARIGVYAGFVARPFNSGSGGIVVQDMEPVFYVKGEDVHQ